MRKLMSIAAAALVAMALAAGLPAAQRMAGVHTLARAADVAPADTPWPPTTIQL